MTQQCLSTIKILREHEESCDDYGNKQYLCPSCKDTSSLEPHFNYCHNCGIKLLWEIK